jgi:peptidoglycan/xylan/chitin deacetylase (PgdA/CDA1 family)
MINDAVKMAAHRLGALAAYHRVRNRRTLTVLMFHRILPAAERDLSGADPLYTVTPHLFEEILAFARRHYSLVGLDDVVAARARRAALPPRALLITFDDGWRDNRDLALPILDRGRVPAVVFVASDAIDDTGVCWWQEVVLWSLRSGRKSYDELCREAGGAAPEHGGEAGRELRLIERYGTLDSARRGELLAPLARELEGLQQRHHMLDAASLRELAAGGVGIGVHGAAHLPLTGMDDPSGDLQKAKRRIAAAAGLTDVRTLSFPNGRYDARVVGAARQLGFDLQFTSDAVINACPAGWLETDLVGRIPVFPHEVARPDGQLSQARLARWLFLRPRTCLTCRQAGA